MKLLDTTPKLMHPFEASFLAEQLNEGDEDWTYVVDMDPKGTGWARIEIYDEDGEFVAYVT